MASRQVLTEEDLQEIQRRARAKLQRAREEILWEAYQQELTAAVKTPPSSNPAPIISRPCKKLQDPQNKRPGKTTAHLSTKSSALSKERSGLGGQQSSAAQETFAKLQLELQDLKQKIQDLTELCLKKAATAKPPPTPIFIERLGQQGEGQRPKKKSSLVHSSQSQNKFKTTCHPQPGRLSSPLLNNRFSHSRRARRTNFTSLPNLDCDLMVESLLDSLLLEVAQTLTTKERKSLAGKKSSSRCGRKSKHSSRATETSQLQQSKQDVPLEDSLDNLTLPNEEPSLPMLSVSSKQRTAILKQKQDYEQHVGERAQYWRLAEEMTDLLLESTLCSVAHEVHSFSESLISKLCQQEFVPQPPPGALGDGFT